MDLQHGHDLAGQLLIRLNRAPRPYRVIEPPLVEKGLNPYGVAIVITAAGMLITFPLFFMVSCGALAGSVASTTSSSVATTWSPAGPWVRTYFKRVGKDVHATVMVDNTTSSSAWSAVYVRMKVGGKAAVTPHPPLGAIPAWGKRSFVLTFRDVPDGTVEVVTITDYKSASDSGSTTKVERRKVP